MIVVSDKDSVVFLQIIENDTLIISILASDVSILTIFSISIENRFAK